SVVIQPVSNIPYLVGVGMFVAFSDGKARRRRSRFGENFKKNFALSSNWTRHFLMIDYRNNPDNNIVELTVEGTITTVDFESAIAQLKTDIQTHGKLRLLEEIRSFKGIDPIALWKDAQFGLSHANDFTHVAVVADAQWMRTIAAAAGNLLSAEVKAFEAGNLKEARDWLSTAPEAGANSKFEYTNNDTNNIVEIVVEGTITEADIDRVLPLVKADLAKHGKIKVLEEIRSFEGMDPMALWKDIQQAYLIKDITHVAVVADAQWVRTVAEAVSAVFPAEIKAFERSRIEDARLWLASCG
ncbi:MAG: STAS/SEC14 domain-containing protein, partial [Cyanobacteria bacterium P01_F01_bin.53]